MAELVDARDLKSRDHYDREGSSPSSGTIFVQFNITQYNIIEV